MIAPATPASRSLAICADDFGRDLPQSQAIVALARQGRVSALSCLADGNAWTEAARLLAAVPQTVSCGLHFNLTEGTPMSPALRRHWPRLPALPRLIAAAHLGRMPLPALTEEWRAQWDAFTDATGRPPDFVDGHQHVHHLPGVREIVVAAARHGGVAVRNTGHVGGPGFAGKRWLIEHTGGRGLQRALRAGALPHNDLLLGVYGFRQPDYRSLMRGWLAACPARGALLFCHPGASDGDAARTPARADPDPIAAARAREACYLASDAFLADLAAAGVSLAPGWPQRSSDG